MTNNTINSRVLRSVFFAVFFAVSGLASCGSGGGGGSTTTAPNVSIFATSTSIPYNASTAISWTSANSDSCTSSGGGGSNSTGTFNTGPLTTTTTYTVTCGSASKSVTITVASSAVSSAITGFASAGVGIVTVTSANTLTNGAFITISGTTNYNGTYTVANRTLSNFTINATFVANNATGIWGLTGGMISGCSTSGATGAITLSNVPSRFSGVAPLSVFFDAADTTTTPATPQPFHDLEYHWGFGDTSSGNWGDKSIGSSGTGANTSRNIAYGPVAAHVFETPGLYTVSLSATDGTNTVTNSCAQIAVLYPDAVFTGTKTICFSTSGTFIGCPAGATNVTTSNFVTALSGYQGTTTRLLFRRGETFTAATTALITANGPGVVGAFGIGTAPIVQMTGNVQILGIGYSSASVPNISDWRIMDLEFDGLSKSASVGIETLGGINQVLILNMNMHDIKDGVIFNDSLLSYYVNPDSWPNIQMFDDVAIVNSTITPVVGLNTGWRMFISANHLSILGNALGDMTGTHGGGSHVVRLPWANKAVVSSNTIARSPLELALKLHSQAWCDSTLSTGSGYTGICSTVDNTAPPVTTTYVTDLHPMGIFAATSGYTEQVIVSDNKFIGAGSPYLVVTGPQNSNRDERVRDVIFERNWLQAGGGLTSTAFVLHSDTTTVRNNLCDMTNGVDGPTCFSVTLYGVGSPAKPPDLDNFYNNTAYRGSNTTTPNLGDALLVAIDTTSTNITIQNNLVYAPLYSSAVVITGTGASGLVTSNNSSNAQAITSPSFASPIPSNPLDFRISTGSYAKGLGTTIPVWSDFFLTSRPQGSGMIDLGDIKGP